MKKVLLAVAILIFPIKSVFGQGEPCAQTDIWCPDAIRNSLLSGAAEMIDQTIVEYEESESADLNVLTAFDYERFVDYNTKLVSYFDKIFNTARADNPHTFDLLYTITYQAEPLDFSSVNNESVRTLLRLHVDLLGNTTRSESADASNGIQKADYDRVIGNLAQIRSFLDEFFNEDQPHDLPQHSATETAIREAGGS